MSLGHPIQNEPPTPASPPRQVIGVVRHKYLFKNRPRAMISKPTGRGGAPILSLNSNRKSKP